MHDDIVFKNVLSALGYWRQDGYNPRYFPLEEFSKIRTASHFQHVVNRINHDEDKLHDGKIEGAYFLQTSTEQEQTETLRPLVFVARAKNETRAREIHRCLWNLGSVAFVIIVLPGEVRVYTGFDYDRKNKNRGLIEKIHFEQIGLFLDITETVISALEKYSTEAVDNGSIWQVLRKSKRVNYDNRVDKKLLRSLKELESELLVELPILEKPISLRYIHAIIGKYVYLRYLYDRKILTREWAQSQDIDLEKVLNRGATCDELLKLDHAIERRFGGNVFPLPKDFSSVFKDELVSFVASVFKGDQAVGKQQVLFDVYNFSYIPVEMLSYIYEQFLQAQGKTKKEGAVYTPEALADYVINETFTIRPLTRRMKILDPCCGSGIFLVLAYRYLIELELLAQDTTRLSPMELRQIMEDCIYGVELNLEACYVTEFSLILILLNYIEPPDLTKNKNFRFPRLHEKNIFQGNFFDDSEEFYPLSLEFDWIIGNPPWKTVDVDEHPEDALVLSWITDNANTRPVGDKRIEEAFAWRALEFLKADGCIGFVITAKRLFNDTSKNFRKEFFRQTYVRRVTNLSSFHYLLFPADVSPMTIIYQKSDDNGYKQPIWHYGPFAANQVASRVKEKSVRPIWIIAVNKSEIKKVPYGEALTGDALTWKVALWGSYEDRQAIERLTFTCGQTLAQICERRHWNLLYGLQLRNKKELELSEVDENSATSKKSNVKPLDPTLFEVTDNDLYELEGSLLNELDVKYHIPKSVLKIILPERRYYRARGGSAGEKLIRAPHIVINPNYVIFSDIDFVIGEQTGISAPIEDEAALRALSIYLSSSVGKYLTFFHSSSWGIDRTTVRPTDLRDVVIPDFTNEEERELAALQRSISERERDLYRNKDIDAENLFERYSEVETNYTREDLQDEIDRKVEKLMDLPKSISTYIHDFINIRLSLNKGKTNSNESYKVRALDTPSLKELETYALRLREHLDDYSREENVKHLVSIIYSNDLTICQISPVNTIENLDVFVIEAVEDWNEKFRQINKGLQERFSQWFYFQRELRIFDSKREVVSICKPSRLIHWMESKAISDANDIIAESISSENLLEVSSMKSYDSNYSDSSKIN